LDEVAVFSGALSEQQIFNAMTSGVENFNGGDPWARLDDGTLTDPQERADYVHNVLGTWIGDSNRDLEFDSSDLVTVFVAGKYETGEQAGWSQGDWSGNGIFDSTDMVTAFVDGGYEQGPHPAVIAVPEPASIVMLLASLAGIAIHRLNGRRYPQSASAILRHSP
jgi:hypothetical protein